MIVGEDPISTRPQRVRWWESTSMTVFYNNFDPLFGSRQTQSRYTLIHECLTHQRLRSGFYSVLLASYRGPKYTNSIIVPFLTPCVCASLLSYRPIVAFTLRDDEERRTAGDRSERSGQSLGREDLDTSLKVEYHRFARADDRQEHEGTLSALRQDDEGRLTGVAAKRQRQIENYLVFFLSYNNTILCYIITMMYLAV